MRPLLFLYLTRLGAEPWAALAATGIMAITGPYFYYSNQIYPKSRPVAIVLIVPAGPAYTGRSPAAGTARMGRWETPLLGLLTLLLCCLPLLHPRYVPLGLLCGALVLLQAWHSRERWLALCLIGLVVAVGLYAVIAYHLCLQRRLAGSASPGKRALGRGTSRYRNLEPFPSPVNGLHVRDGHPQHVAHLLLRSVRTAHPCQVARPARTHRASSFTPPPPASTVFTRFGSAAMIFPDAL